MLSPSSPTSDKARSPSRRLDLLALACLLGLGLLGPAQASDSLHHCRSLRLSEPAEALPHCERAAREQAASGATEDAFEAWMHASELSSQLGEPERAAKALEAAVALLPQVSDPLAAQRLARRRGLNAYRAGEPLQALGHFLEALAAARAAGDEGARAISENDLGVTYRHLGNYEAALAAFETSLALREAGGEGNLGALLANIGSLYLELGDRTRARSYLQRAFDDHSAAGRSMAAERTREELSRLALLEQRNDEAETLLAQAWEAYRAAGSPRDMERLAKLRARTALAAGDRGNAERWLQAARDAADSGAGTDLELSLLTARLAVEPVALERSSAELEALLAVGEGQVPRLRIEALQQLVALHAALDRPSQALDAQQRLHTEALTLAEARHGERFDTLRVRFDLERLEAEAARRESELTRRRLETVSVGAAGLVALALLGLFTQRRFYRQRLVASRERQALEQRVAEARKSAEDLRCDLRSMVWLLDRQQSACLVFDAAGRIRAATAAAAQALDRRVSELQGAPLAELLGSDTAHWALERVEAASLAPDIETNAILGTRSLPLPTPIEAQCELLNMEEELGVLRLITPPPSTGGTTVAGKSAAMPEQDTNALAPCAPPSAANTPEAGSDAPDQDQREAFRRLLVRLMRTSVEAWERASRKGRVDLAEASGVWRITIDDGRLRVRAMDRYLSLDTLPERPRWREVLRTAYFLLGEVDIGDVHRRELEAMVEAVLQATRPRL